MILKLTFRNSKIFREELVSTGRKMGEGIGGRRREGEERNGMERKERRGGDIEEKGERIDGKARDGRWLGEGCAHRVREIDVLIAAIETLGCGSQ
jgi:hypothetical protein